MTNNRECLLVFSKAAAIVSGPGRSPATDVKLAGSSGLAATLARFVLPIALSDDRINGIIVTPLGGVCDTSHDSAMVNMGRIWVVPVSSRFIIGWGLTRAANSRYGLPVYDSGSYTMS